MCPSELGWRMSPDVPLPSPPAQQISLGLNMSLCPWGLTSLKGAYFSISEAPKRKPAAYQQTQQSNPGWSRGTPNARQQRGLGKISRKVPSVPITVTPSAPCPASLSHPQPPTPSTALCAKPSCPPALHPVMSSITSLR